MNDFKKPEISKEDQDIIKNLLKNHADLVILGPAGTNSDSNHLRIYANGGAIGYVPLSKRAEWLLPTDEYIKHNDGLEEYFATFEKYKYAGQRKNFKQELYNGKDFVAKLIEATDENFRQKNKNNENYDNNRKERSIQTKLVRKYLSEDIKSGFLICDMEHCVPKKDYLDGCSTYLTQYEHYFSEPINYKEKAPKFDIIAINPDWGKIGFIELKCNKKACLNGSGLKVHLKDTLASMDLPRVRERIADRFSCLRDCGFLPAELKGIESAFLDYKAFCGFLFVKGTDLQTKASAIEICETALEEILIGENDIKDRLLFLFAENADSVNLNEMQPWDEFCK